eukprot:TRINITY_DN449_c0_g1_i4.p1 TRINITY_DN449_c0_g1~~TRINITY_DN449_c0_g1_i4.p1  ORF type:complete len:578 (+),score=80.92 TRINITY_DN449_c0_g1_i4:170-1903(+)
MGSPLICSAVVTLFLSVAAVNVSDILQSLGVDLGWVEPSSTAYWRKVASVSGGLAQLGYCDWQGATADLCHVDIRRSYIQEVSDGSLPEVCTGGVLRLTLVTVDVRSGSPCETGGAYFEVTAQGPALLPGVVTDRFDGTYDVAVETGLLPGEFQMAVVMETDQCQSTTRCSVHHTVLNMRVVGMQSSDDRMHWGDLTPKIGRSVPPFGRRMTVPTPPVRAHTFTVTNSCHAVSPALRPDWAAGGASWEMVSSSQSEWVQFVKESFTAKGAPLPWTGYPLTPDPRAAFGVYRLRKAPWARRPSDDEMMAALRNRFFFLSGKSMITTTFRAIIAAVRVLARTRTHTARVRVVTVTRQLNFAYVPTLNLLLIRLTHPQTYDQDGNPRVTDLVPPVQGKLLAPYFDAYLTRRSKSMAQLLNIGPSVFLYNRGIHSAHVLNSTAAAWTFLRNQQLEMGSWVTELGNERNVSLVWQSTAPTQYMVGRPSPFWKCRTRGRLRCLSELSALRMRASGGPWLLHDVSRLTHARADLMIDNRHYNEGPGMREPARAMLEDLVLRGIRADPPELAGLVREVGTQPWSH